MNILDVKKIENGVVLTCYDESQSIVGDRCMVKIRFGIVIPWDEWMDDVIKEEGIAPESVQNDDGDLALDLMKERIFVDESKKDEVAVEIIAEMQGNILAYLAHPSFIEKFLRKQISEVSTKVNLYDESCDDLEAEDDDGPADFSACFK